VRKACLAFGGLAETAEVGELVSAVAGPKLEERRERAKEARVLRGRMAVVAAAPDGTPSASSLPNRARVESVAAQPAVDAEAEARTRVRPHVAAAPAFEWPDGVPPDSTETRSITSSPAVPNPQAAGPARRGVLIAASASVVLVLAATLAANRWLHAPQAEARPPEPSAPVAPAAAAPPASPAESTATVASAAAPLQQWKLSIRANAAVDRVRIGGVEADPPNAREAELVVPGARPEGRIRIEAYSGNRHATAYVEPDAGTVDIEFENPIVHAPPPQHTSTSMPPHPPRPYPKDP